MSISLYSDDNPKTTIKGFGYKNKEKAEETIKLVEKTNRGINYKFQVINTMYYRAKHHKNKTKGMEEAMKVFKKWLDNYKKMKKNEEDKFPFLKLRLIRSYEKLADFYNISLKARGLEKPTTSDEGFLVVYRRLKGNINKLKSCPVKKNKPDGDNWYNKRNSQVKAKFSQAKKMKLPFFHEKGELKGLPTKIHINMIMWAYSPYPDLLEKNKKLLKNIKK